MELGTFIGQICRYDRQEYFECYGQIEERLHNLEKILGTLEESQRSMILEQMEHQAGEAPVWMRIHLLSFCMKVSKTPAYTQELLQTVLDADWNEVGEYEKLSDYWQIGTAVRGSKGSGHRNSSRRCTGCCLMLFAGRWESGDGTMSRQRRETGIWSL